MILPSAPRALQACVVNVIISTAITQLPNSTKRKRFNFASKQNDDYLQQLIQTVHGFI